MKRDAIRDRRIAGITAIAAGIAQVAYFVLYNRGLISNQGEALFIVSWNLALIPTALLLWQRLHAHSPYLTALYTMYGLMSLLLWASSSAMHAITLIVEATYIFLSAVWWLGIGSLLRPERTSLGIFTMVVGLFAFIDATASVFESVSLLFALGGLKLPLALVWNFWIGTDLLMRPLNES